RALGRARVREGVWQGGGNRPQRFDLDLSALGKVAEGRRVASEEGFAERSVAGKLDLHGCFLTGEAKARDPASYPDLGYGDSFSRYRGGCLAVQLFEGDPHPAIVFSQGRQHLPSRN